MREGRSLTVGAMDQAWKTVIAGTGMALLCVTGCAPEPEAQPTKVAGAEAVQGTTPEAAEAKEDGPESVAFAVVLEYDTFGSFLPITNHFWKKGDPDRNYAGFLIQLADFKSSVPNYGSAEFTPKDPEHSWTKGGFKWIDIVCDPEIGDAPGPLSPELFSNAKGPNELAPMLLPEGKGNEKHLVHGAMKPNSVAILTLWRGARPVQVESIAVKGLDEYSQFTFESQEACRVDVWKDFSGTDPAKRYKPGEV